MTLLSNHSGSLSSYQRSNPDRTDSSIQCPKLATLIILRGGFEDELFPINELHSYAEPLGIVDERPFRYYSINSDIISTSISSDIGKDS